MKVVKQSWLKKRMFSKHTFILCPQILKHMTVTVALILYQTVLPVIVVFVLILSILADHPFQYMPSVATFYSDGTNKPPRVVPNQPPRSQPPPATQSQRNYPPDSLPQSSYPPHSQSQPIQPFAGQSNPDYPQPENLFDGQQGFPSGSRPYPPSNLQNTSGPSASQPFPGNASGGRDPYSHQPSTSADSPNQQESLPASHSYAAQTGIGKYSDPPVANVPTNTTMQSNTPSSFSPTRQPDSTATNAAAVATGENKPETSKDSGTKSSKNKVKKAKTRPSPSPPPPPQPQPVYQEPEPTHPSDSIQQRHIVILHT